MTEVANAASSLAEEFDDHLDLEEAEVEDEISELMSEYSLPVDEARRSVRNNLLDEAGIEDSDGAVPPASGSDSEFDPTPVEEIDSDNEWHDLRVELIQLWDPNSEDMEQVGLIGDESDVIKFTLWEDTDGIPALEKGKTYHIQNVVTDEYNGRYSVKFTKASSIAVADDDPISDTGGEVTVSGMLVEVKSGSGLIKRCPDEDCTRVINNGRCAEHGPVDGEFDLRIKAVIDDGYTAQNVVFGQEATTDITGISLDDAREMAKDALDTSVVAQEIEADVIGNYFEVEGPELGQNVVVNDADIVAGPSDDAVASLTARLDESEGMDDDAVDADTEPGQSEASA